MVREERDDVIRYQKSFLVIFVINFCADLGKFKHLYHLPPRFRTLCTVWSSRSRGTVGGDGSCLSWERRDDGRSHNNAGAGSSSQALTTTRDGEGTAGSDQAHPVLDTGQDKVTHSPGQN